MKCKILSLILAGGLILSSGMTAMAAENSENKPTMSIYEAIETLPTEELVSYLYELSADDNSKDFASDQYYVDCWNELKRSNKIYVEPEGHFALDDTVVDQYAELADVIEIWNYAIDLGILAMDYETMLLYIPEITDDVLDNISSNIMALNENAVTYVSDHGCGLSEWDVGATVAANYKTISNYYAAMRILHVAQVGEINAQMATAIYWVGYVREGGAWDYKSIEGYKDRYFCCTYGEKSNQDHHVSWVGNYNYGYTGRIIFDLAILHFGSSAVAGFDPKDEIEDWPAIDEGYYDAPFSL